MVSHMAPPQKYPMLYDVAWMTERNAEGLGAKDVARQLGCSLASVSRAAKNIGVEFAQRAAPRWEGGVCEQCDQPFAKTSGVQRFCSPACRAGMPNLTSTCEQCGEPFTETLTGARAKRMPGRKYCGRRCRNLAIWGKESARYLDGRGYVRIGTPDGRSMSEHRYVMELKLNRRLLPGETVHHINGVRDDNREENLQLRKGNHGPGAAFVCRTCGSHDIVSTILDAP